MKLRDISRRVWLLTGIALMLLVVVAVPVQGARPQSTPATPDWQQYVPAPSSTDAKPVRVTSTSGNVTNAQALVDGSGSTVLTMPTGGAPATVILDYGREVGGLPYFTVSNVTGTIPARLIVANSESLGYLSTPGSTTLVNALAPGATNASVASVSNFVAGNTLRIGSETATITNVGTAAGTATTLFSPAAIGDTNVKVAGLSGFGVGGSFIVDTGSNLEQRTVTAVGTAGTATTMPSTSTTLAVASSSLLGAANIGDTVISVASNTGFTAGQTIGIDSGANAESAIINSIATIGLPVPLYPATPVPPVANWIWNTAGAGSSAAGPIYLRKDFTIANPALVTNAPLRTNCDDGCTTYVNGVQVSNNPSVNNGWRTSQLVNIAPLLVAGNNVVAINGINTGSGGSVIAAMQINTASDSTRYVTDTSWKALAGTPASGPTGWTTASFDDTAWGNAIISQAYGGSPWNTSDTVPASTATYNFTLSAPLTRAHAASTILGTITPAGVTNLKVTSVTGFSAGQQITIDAGSNLETATISAVGTAGSTGTGLTLAAPTILAHTGAVAVNVLVVASAGSTNVKVASVTGFAVGDTMTIDTGAALETLTVTAVGTAGTAGTGISFTPALAASHYAPAAVRDLGTGVTFSPALSLAHAQGTTLRGLGTGITFTPAVASAHAVGETVTGSPGALASDNGGLQTFNVSAAGTQTGALRGGLRFMAIQLQTAGTITLSAAGLTFKAYLATPDKYQGYFLSSSDELNKIWFAGAYTVQMDMVPVGVSSCFTVPVIFDGAKRDRAIWTGDLVIEDPVALLSLGTNGQPYVQGSLGRVFSNQMASGRLYGAEGFNGCGGFDYSADYSAYAAIAAIDYYRYTGDSAYLTALLPQLERAATYAATLVDANGLVVSNDRDYWQTSQSGEVTEYSLIYYSFLQKMIWLEGQIGTPAGVDEYTAKAAAIKQAINARLWNATAGAYQQSNTSTAIFPLDANANAINFGVAPADRVQGILTFLKGGWNAYGAQITQPSPSLTDPYGHTIEPFNNSMETEARFTGDDTTDALGLMDLLWGPMVDPNNPYYTFTFHEFFSPTGTMTRSSDSLAHGWAAGPTQQLTEYVLGVKPINPGYATFSIMPHPDSLAWAQGKVPTPHGDIPVSWKQGAWGFALTTTIPSGTQAKVYVPINGMPGTTVNVDGTDVTGMVEGNYLSIDNMGPGMHTFKRGDLTAPVTTISLLAAPTGGLYPDPVTVTFAATDDASGVDSTTYRLNGGAWTTYSGPFQVPSGPGHNVIEFYSTDVAGNVEATQSKAFDIVFTPMTVSGQVFNDLNGNGSKDASENGIANWTVQLINAATSTVVSTKTTDASGNFSFANVGAGTYEVRESLKTSYVQTTANPAGFTAMSGVNVAGQSFGVVKPVDLQVAVVQSTGNQYAGYPMTYTINAYNNGPAAAQNMIVSDVLPVSTTFVSYAAPAGWTCTAPAVGAAGTFSCADALMAQGKAVLSMTVLVDPNVANTSKIVDTATVSSDVLDSKPANNSYTVSRLIYNQSDVSIQEVGNSLGSGKVQYMFTIQNAGPNTAKNVNLTDALAATTAPASFTASQGSCTLGQKVTCALGDVAMGSTVTVTITVNVTGQPSSIVNTGKLTTATVDPHPADKSATAVVTGPF